MTFRSIHDTNLGETIREHIYHTMGKNVIDIRDVNMFYGIVYTDDGYDQLINYRTLEFRPLRMDCQDLDIQTRYLISNIWYFLESNGMTQEYLSKVSGVPVSNIRLILSGEGNPTLRTLNLIAKAFDIPTWFLLN